MHQPLPNGYFGPDDLSSEDFAFAEGLMRRLTNIKQLGGFDSLRLTRALPSGNGAVMAMDMGGVRKVFVSRVPVQQPVQEQDDGSVTLDVPMLFCGVVEKAAIHRGGKVAILVSKQTRRRLQGYADAKEAGEDISERHELEKFAIPYDARFKEFEPKNPGDMLHTQYALLRPSWYSGALAAAVQIVSGYGKSKFSSRPTNPVETANLKIPGKWRAKIQEQLAEFQLFCSTGKPPVDGQVKFNFKFDDCNGITFGADNKPWLLRITPAGVYAMPLPLVPATTTKAFKEFIEEVGDSELLWAIDKFGGLPTGETFPAIPKAFKAWERAGVIIKVCSTSDFYDNLTYSTAMGWSFNERGTEAYNTCYDYDDGQGLAYGLMYGMWVVVGATRDLTRQEPTDQQKATAGQVGRYIGELVGLSKKDRDEGAALRFKLSVVSFDEIEQRMVGMRDINAEYEYWVNYQLPPIATATGSVRQVSKGWLHTLNGRYSQPQMKFPEPLLGYCVSFDFRPLLQGLGKNPNCDTVMMAYYVGNDLKVVKYFKETREISAKTESDMHECMTVGSWTETQTSAAFLNGNFYTSDIDDRVSRGATKQTTKIVGKDLGFSSKPGFSFDDFFSRVGTIYRKRYYTHHKTVELDNGSTREIGLCAPYLCRDAVLHARRDRTGIGFKSESLSLGSVQDPTTYRYWTYHPLYAWRGSLPKETGQPSPKDGSPVWVEIEQHTPVSCSEFADAGSWIKGLPADYTWLVYPVKGTWNLNMNDEGPKVNTYSTGAQTPAKDERRLDLSLMETTRHVKESDVSGQYFTHSPDEYGLTFSRSATTNKAGSTVFGVVTDPPPRLTHFGYTRFYDGKSIPAFIGVINE